MKNIQILLIATMFFGCDQKASESSAVKVIPDFNLDALIKLSVNEKNELERRCLGVNHPTCNTLKSKEYKDKIESWRKACMVGAAFQMENRKKEEDKCLSKYPL